MSKNNRLAQEATPPRQRDLRAARSIYETELRRYPAYWRIRLVPDHPVHLLAVGCIDDVAFAWVFKELVWPRIPRHHQNRILRHWEAGDGKLRGGPSIAVLPDLSVFGATLGVCSPCAHFVWFWAGAVGPMPARPLASLIAHELAHVVDVATRRYSSDDEERAEAAARELQMEWGFAPQAPVQWFRRHALDALRWSARRDPQIVKGFLRTMRAFARESRLSD